MVTDCSANNPAQYNSPPYVSHSWKPMKISVAAPALTPTCSELLLCAPLPSYRHHGHTRAQVQQGKDSTGHYTNHPRCLGSYRGAGQGFCGDNGRTPAPVLEVPVASQQRRWETKPHHGPLPRASQAAEGIVIILEGEEEEHCCNANGKHPNHEPNKVFSILLQQLVSTVDCIVVPASTTEPNNALLTRMVYICQHVIMME